MKELIRAINYSKADIINGSMTPDTIQTHDGDSFKLVGVGLYKKEEIESGKTTIISVMKVVDTAGEIHYISSISENVCESLQMIIAAYDEKEISDGINIQVKSGKSKSNRTFYYIQTM